MKLKKLRLRNFCKFTDFECEFNNKITHLVGMNGSGKTTIGLTAIWAGIKGIAERKKIDQVSGERFRFIGSHGKSADIELEFFDEKKQMTIKIKNHITNSGNQISFESTDGNIDENWINTFFNVSFLSAKHFSELSSKDQALALGIDTSQYDEDIAKIKSEYILINRDLKKLGKIELVEKIEPVDINKLVEERKKREEYNNKQNDRQRVINDNEDRQSYWLSEIKEANRVIKEANEELSILKQHRLRLSEPTDRKQLDDIDDQIKQSTKINNRAKDYQDYLIKVKESDKIKSQLEKNKQEQDTKQSERTAYIQKKKLPFSDLVINEKGELLLKNRPIKSPYFSKGELEIIVARLYTALYEKDDDALKMRFIDDFELLDEENQDKLLDGLLKKGYQILTAEVGYKNRENCILLRECKIMEYEDNKEEIF